MTVHYDLHGEVALIRLDNPPMNGLSLATRQAAVKALQQARQDPEVRAVVLMGAARVFSSGADIKEFGSPLAFQGPNLSQLVAMVGRPTKPGVGGPGRGGKGSPQDRAGPR